MTSKSNHDESSDALPSHTDTTSSSASKWRRLSAPPLPTFRPNIPNLRTALLGYLSEVELALRTRLGDLTAEDEERIRASSASPSINSTSGDDWGTSGDSVDDDFGGDALGYAYASSRTAAGPSSAGLRHRFDISEGNVPATSSLDETSRGRRNVNGYIDSHHLKLLNHLSALREEALNYLPSLPSVNVPSMPIPSRMGMPPVPIPSREWLASLPSRLSIVDPGPGGVGYGDDGKGKQREGEMDRGAIEGARKRVLELVHAVLPSEDWAGWERLGWEEQDEDLAFHDDLADNQGTDESRASARSRARSASLERYGRDEDEEEEPEYLFPNRTPASAQAMARRRRAVRSKSLGASSLPTLLRPAKLERAKTAPYPRDRIRVSGVSPQAKIRSSPLFGYGSEEDDEEELLNDHLQLSYTHGLSRDREQGVDLDMSAEEGIEDEDEQEYLATHPEVTDTKLTALAARKHEIDMGPTVQESLRRSDDGKRLLGYEDLPAIWRNNEHIFTGYRFIPLHLKTGPVPLIKSAFKWHNETLNIHSHFVPTILILLCVPLIIYQSPLPDARPLDTAALVAYLLAATSCLFSSASWHVLSGCASKKWFEWGACVDYIGISWLIAASFGTVVYNGFYCKPKLVLLYCSINAFCGALGSYLPFQRWFNERRNKHLRIGFFLFLCFAMFAPMLQLFYQHGYSKASKFVAPFGWSIIAYLTGLVFYAFHFPECKWPGKFDRYGMSHQWWHAGIVLAIWLHYRALFVAHKHKDNLSCAASGAGRSVAEVLEGWLGLASA
ncbi:hypothetical protein I316_02066 [Kwoniella heveanensis BCC8398]|uniref:Uncharacterized protein n=1 Tax=Kwoniella heveanensis BCC8398 TaxID=1296120 RepID=A0A1B9GYV2_9TREE|nr:hypothetical protein I316_02066 [Kwoniella heveanensis BCC8398]